MNTDADMSIAVLAWDRELAKARVEITFEGWSLGERWIDEATLMVVTGSALAPERLVGRSFTRVVSYA